MKKILFSILLLCATAHAQVVTTIITVTNLSGTVNGNTITVNGHLRLWTNSVTSVNTQIQTANTIGGSATNLLNDYAAYPEASLTLSMVGTNGIMLQSYPGFPNVVTISTGWGLVVSTTATITNLPVFRGTAANVGLNELTNTANGIVSFLSSLAVTNPIPTNAPALAFFLTTNNLAATTNFILAEAAAATNFTTLTSNGLAAINITTSNAIIAATNGILSAAYHASTDFQPAAANLTDWALVSTNSVLSLLVGTSYLDGSGNVQLIDGTPTTRFTANKGGDTILFFYTGNDLLHADGSSDVFIKDNSGVIRWESDDASVNGGATILRSHAGTDAIKIDGTSSVQKNLAPAIAFNENVQPVVAIGTVTNFISSVNNSGSSETHLNSFTFPANTLNHNGDTITRTIGITTAANANAKTVKIYFDGTSLVSASSSVSGASFYATITITRDSSSSYRSMASITTGSGALGATPGTADAFVNTVSGEDYTTVKECNVSCTGTTSSDLTVVLDRIEFKPSHDYAF